MSTDTQSHFVYKGILTGHNGWVTSIATTPAQPDMIVSASRDKTLLVWELKGKDPSNYGYPKKALIGHAHFVSDVVISSDAQYAISSSWDKTLRLWHLASGKTTRRFVDHEKDVLSVAFSRDNRQIVSGSRDKTVKLWNTLGQCKYTFTEQGHTDWVSCVRFSPANTPIVVSGGWDRIVKVWNLQTCKLTTNLIGHTGYINSITVSPDGSLCASGGKDGISMLWDLNKGEHLYSLTSGNIIHALTFSPNRYWLCAATDTSIKIWDLQTKAPVAELCPDNKKAQCISLAWSADGSTLYSGYTDNKIRVWGVVSSSGRS